MSGPKPRLNSFNMKIIWLYYHKNSKNKRKIKLDLQFEGGIRDLAKTIALRSMLQLQYQVRWIIPNYFEALTD